MLDFVEGGSRLLPSEHNRNPNRTRNVIRTIPFVGPQFRWFLHRMSGTLDRSRDSQHSPSRPFGPPRPRWPAMLGSLIAHTTVVLGLVWLFTAGPSSSGTTASPKERRVGMAIVHR